MLSIFKGDQEEIRPRDPGSIWQGIALGGTWNACALAAGVILIVALIGIFIVAGFGLVQYFWILPLYEKYNRRGETETAKGILIASGITVLLSAACWGSMIR
jgi:ABC-type phosphate transport system auxiliary subunit